MNKYKVIKNWMTLVENDIISIYKFDYNKFEFEVTNRMIDYREYIKFKDRTKDSPDYVWRQKERERFTVMTFTAPDCPANKDKDLCNLYSQHDWVNICIENTINDLITIGVIEVV